MARVTGQAGINLIKEAEGFNKVAYIGPEGGSIYTIGYGHRSTSIKKGQEITKPEAEKLLKQDLKKFEKYVNDVSYVPFTAKLNQNQFDALVSFTYNLGPGGLSDLCKVGMNKVAEEMLRYTHSNGKELDGLVKRRRKESKLFGTANDVFVKRTNPKAKNLKKLKY